MDLNREIVLSEAEIARCKEYGIDAVRAYDEGKNARSHALSSHGADRDVNVWAKSKMGEVAFAKAIGADPFKVLNWQNRADGGHDIVAFNQKIDIKTIDDHKRFLCWPINKNHLYFEKDFDALVLMRGTEPTFRIAGWIAKNAFYCAKQIANGYSPQGLDADTWCMFDRALWKIESLVDLSEKAA